MTPERWQQIERVYHAALERADEQRAGYLQQACVGDDDLRREVESLLTQKTCTDRFLEAPVLEAAVEMLAGEQIGSLVGKQLGPYKILSVLGAGGMGEVYRAEDTRLRRVVALKLLPADLSSDRIALERFTREARAVSALNHPNICTLHDIGQHAGQHFLVLELLEGQSLRERLAGGTIPCEELLDIAIQVANALDVAHRKGIVHRDLKPANLFQTQDGRIKILDFGIAKRAGVAPEDAEDDATLLILTREGSFAGTPAYASPEQVRGATLDGRSDLFSFGVVLYEMATKRLPYGGHTSSELFAEILTDIPRPPSYFRPDLPPPLNKIILRLLEKDPEDRFQTAAALRDALVELRAPAIPVWQRGRVLMGSGALGTLALGAAWFILLRGRPASPSAPIKMEQLTTFTDSAVAPALSPDGKMVAFLRGPNTFVGPGQLYVKQLPGGEPVQITRDATQKMSPVFSPDGSRIAYTVVNENGDWDTWVVPVLGGEPQQFLPNASGLQWIGPQRVLMSEIKTGLHMAIVTTNESRAESRDIYLPEDIRGMAHRSARSPDGNSVLLVEMDRGSWLPCRIVPFAGGSPGRIAGPPQGQCHDATWSPDGRWMFFSSNAGGNFQIWRQRFPNGKPEQITFGPAEAEGIALAPDGKSFITSVGLYQRSVWISDNKAERQVTSEGDAMLPAWGDGFPRSVFSPNGKKLYYLVNAGIQRGFGGGELWVSDLTTKSKQLALPGLLITSYDISPDGEQVAFAAAGPDKKSHIWIARLDRRSAPRQLLSMEALGPVFGNSGEIFFRGPEGNLSYIYELNPESGLVRKAAPEPATNSPIVSPDGQWIVSTMAVYGAESSSTLVKAYPKQGGSPVLVCRGCFVKWPRDGKSIFISFGIGNFKGEGKTFEVALPRGKAFPELPATGLESEAQVQKLGAANVIDTPAVFPGPSSLTYAFTSAAVHRNLYRIELP